MAISETAKQEIDPIARRIRERSDIQSKLGFSMEELRKGFEMVCDPNNWKNPIKAEIHSMLAPLVLESVEFFHGERPATFSIRTEPKTGMTRIMIEGKGYIG